MRKPGGTPTLSARMTGVLIQFKKGETGYSRSRTLRSQVLVVMDYGDSS